MASDIKIWHNPRCSKSRAGLAYLQSKGVEPTIRLYLKDPPDTDELSQVLTKLNLAPRAITRTGENLFRELKLGAGSSDQDLLNALSENPILIERPIIIAGDRAVLGRPAENIDTLL